MKSRVRRATLALSIPEEERNDGAFLRQQAEQRLLPSVLSALNERLDARFGPESVVLARRLVIHCSPSTEELADATWAEEIGRDLAESLIARVTRMTPREREDPRNDDAVVIFENATHWSALRLARAASSAGSAWFVERGDSPLDAWREACRGGAPALRRLLAYLTRLDALERVLNWLPATELEGALESLRIEAWPSAAQAILRRVPSVTESPDDARHDPKPARAFERDPGAHPLTADTHGPAPRAGSGGEALPTLAEPASNGTNAHVTGGVAPGHSVTSSDPSSDGRRLSGAASSGVAEDARRHEPSAVDVTHPGDVRTATRESDQVASHLAARATSESETPSNPALSPDVFVDVSRTDYGGLFYLLRLVLELELAEHLWCAGIPEGPLLTLVGRALLGAEGVADPAPSVLGGDGVVPPVPDWAVDEVRIKSSACLERWLDSRGIDPTHLPSPEALASTLVRPDGVDGGAAELALSCGAVMAIAFCGALEKTPSRAELLSYLRIPARIEMSKDVRVVMPLEAIDANVRRAGLDINPGYLPWKRQAVHIVFEEG